MKIIFSMLLVLFSFSAYAMDDSDRKLANEKPDQGWFWYEKTPDKKPAQSKETIPLVEDETPTKKKEKKPISAAWLRENLPKLHERAIDNPTRANIQAYFYAQRAMMDKAQRYSEAARTVIGTDPLLDENNRVPSSSAGRDAVLNKEYLGKREALKYLAKNVGGLFVFFDSKCDYCRMQARTVNALSKDFGFVVKYISVDGKGLPEIKEFVNDNGHAKLLDLKVYPTTVFVAPPNNYLVVSQGVMAQDQLIDRIILATTDKKLIPSEMLVDTSPWNRGVLTPEDLEDGATDDMEEFVKNLQEKLKKRF